MTTIHNCGEQYELCNYAKQDEQIEHVYFENKTFRISKIRFNQDLSVTPVHFRQVLSISSQQP